MFVFFGRGCVEHLFILFHLTIYSLLDVCVSLLDVCFGRGCVEYVLYTTIIYICFWQRVRRAFII
jgi:hypothetical protein